MPTQVRPRDSFDKSWRTPLPGTLRAAGRLVIRASDPISRLPQRTLAAFEAAGVTSLLDATRLGRMYSGQVLCPRSPDDASARLAVSISPRP